MFVTVGEKLFGIVDRVPGHFYVATPFLHFCELPVFPGRSYLVLEGSQVDPTIFRKGSFSGYSIYWSLKSILMAWFRGLLGLMALAASLTALLTYVVYFTDRSDTKNLYIALAATGTIFVLLGIYWLSHRLTRASPRRLAVMARRLETKYPKAAIVLHAYLEQNGFDSPVAENGQDGDAERFK